MSVVFSTRGVQQARYSAGGPTGIIFGVANGASFGPDATALSGNALFYAANNSSKGCVWPGRMNTSGARSFSVLARFRPGYSNAPATATGIFSLCTGSGNWPDFELSHNTSANFIVRATNELSAIIINSASGGTWLPTSGTWYDIVTTWDGTTTCTVYVDAAANGTIIATGAFSASWSNLNFSEIITGTGKLGLTVNAGRVDEFVIWNTVIDPTSVTLDNGVGSLNGAGRSGLVTVAAFDGLVNTGAGASNILAGVIETIAGVTSVGYYNAPGQTAVVSTVSYGITNNLQGWYVAANSTGVISNIAYGVSGTVQGLYVAVNSASNVISAIAYGVSAQQVGWYVQPGITNVLSTMAFGSSATQQGVYVGPATTDVKLGVAFGASGTLTGSLVTGGGGGIKSANLGGGNSKLISS